MSTIVTRAGKGSALTHNEVDANFTNLNTDKVEKSGTDPVVISVNSSSNALRITQVGAGNALLVEDSANPDSTPFVIDATGKVNKGSTTWYAAAGVTPEVQLNGVGTAASIGLNAWQAGINVQARLYFNRADSATQGDFTDVVDSGDNLGSIHWTGADGTAFIEAASINAAVDGTPGTNDMPGRLVFSTTADNASSPTERMRIDNAGRVGIGATPTAGQSFRVSKTVTGATTVNQILSSGAVQSDVTVKVRYFNSFASTQAASFTLADLTHFGAAQSTFGLNSVVTNQKGFEVENTLTGATNNYGFYSNIAAATGRWNFYANGTAANYFAGNVGIGTSSPAYPLQVSTAAETNIAITGGTSSETNIFFGDSGSAVIGRITYNNNGDFMRFNTNGSEQMRITSTGDLQFNSGYGSVATAYGCRAWVNFNGTGTVAIRASGNVSSITDNGTGDYTANFTTAMPDGNYALTTAGSLSNVTGTSNRSCFFVIETNTGSTRIRTVSNQTSSAADFSEVHVGVFR
jgi:hypothetical protein